MNEISCNKCKSCIIQGKNSHIKQTNKAATIIIPYTHTKEAAEMFVCEQRNRQECLPFPIHKVCSCVHMHAPAVAAFGYLKWTHTRHGTGDGIFVMCMHRMLMCFNAKCMSVADVQTCKNFITTAVDFIAHTLIHTNTSISSKYKIQRKTSFLFLLHTHTQNIHS